MRRRGWAIPEPDVPPHLEPGDVTELDDATTAGVDLTGAVLPGLSEAQVEGSDLSRVRAGGGQWERVTLADCRLDGADLANLVWRDGSLLRCSLREARMTGALLAGVRLRSTLLEGVQGTLTSWHGAQLRSVVLRGCDLSEASFTETVMEEVLLEDCVLSGAQLSGLRCRDVQLRGCRLDGVGGVSGLRGARVAEEDAIGLLPALARELGLTISG
ncbi:pentapeptide repeat-containing protein [Georgenia satyanarayanai]|uniref:pentapeptide repeat-containing protein n=1 Tax=Georgenia satyanarayanai TaxID=860221 RepID=UPI00203FD5CB|nr:pentapeptide repeat-containing protein [Georgenia satyanarayanai]MCM3661422.1 pentapeptide repeat-containing protein [Georgenia satyanarayanai]